MRLSEDLPLDPEVRAELEAIDATLRGEAVDPIHAELAELALLLAAQRSPLPVAAAHRLDAAVARRFDGRVAGLRAGDNAQTGAAVGSSADRGGRDGRRPGARGARLGGWVRRPAFGLGLASVAAVAIAVVVVSNLGQPASLSSGTTNYASATTAGTSAAAGGTSAAAGGSGAAAGGSGAAKAFAAQTPTASAGGSVATHANGTASHSAAKQALSAPSASTTYTAPVTNSPSRSAASAKVPQSSENLFPPGLQAATTTPDTVPSPSTNGRKTIQSAQLQLIASGERIDDVSQELFAVVGQEGGIVNSSTVTAAGASSGYASFQLSIPSANLATTMTELSELRYAHVGSRTDATQDVNGQYLSDVRALADAQALRTALLKQLADATTQAQIGSLTTQIQDAEATIASDEKTLSSLNGRISYSQLQVKINAGTVVPTPVGGSSGGFTLQRAWHDAVRVLTVSAGVGLVALAALLPLALLVALGLWIASALRRHRREAALDAA